MAAFVYLHVSLRLWNVQIVVYATMKIVKDGCIFFLIKAPHWCAWQKKSWPKKKKKSKSLSLMCITLWMSPSIPAVQNKLCKNGQWHPKPFCVLLHWLWYENTDTLHSIKQGKITCQSMLEMGGIARARDNVLLCSLLSLCICHTQLLTSQYMTHLCPLELIYSDFSKSFKSAV